RLWIGGQPAAPVPAFALRAILWMARGKRCAFPTAHPQAGGCPQAPQPVIIIHVHGGKIQGEFIARTRHCKARGDVVIHAG
ncbi:MAG: hypothetical protein LBE06_03465, partial [Azoarcus sp.]|nr:hypothetical protein [Azoarcus sp.]